MAARKHTYSIYPAAPASHTNWQQSIRVIGRTSDDTRIDKQHNQAKQDFAEIRLSFADEELEPRPETPGTICRDAHRSATISNQRTPLIPLTGNTSTRVRLSLRLTKAATPRSCAASVTLRDSTLEEHLQQMSFNASSASRSSDEGATGLRSRGSSVISEPLTRVSPTSTLDKRVLYTTRSTIPKLQAPPHATNFEWQFIPPTSVALQNTLLNRTVPNPSPVTARATTPAELSRKPLPVRPRTTSLTSHQSHFVNTSLTPTSPTSPPHLPTLPASPLSSLANYPNESEPQSFWESDDDADDDEKTLMGRMKSSLHLPRRLSGGDRERDRERKQNGARDGRVGGTESAKTTSWRRGASLKRFVLCV